MATNYIDSNLCCPYYLKLESKINLHEIICFDECSNNTLENLPISRRFRKTKDFETYLDNYCCNKYGGYKRCDFYKIMSEKHSE